jgi:hypothetical protein
MNNPNTAFCSICFIAALTCCGETIPTELDIPVRAQTCTNSTGGFTCSCNSGYILNGDGLACDDIDECTANTDGCAQGCTNSTGVESEWPECQHQVGSFPGLNLGSIPWHNGSGAWGPQVLIEYPSLPVTMKTVNVSTPQEFRYAASDPGTEIVITTGWAGNLNVVINANDIDVVIPPNVAIGGVELGTWPRQTPISRVRIRGPVPGTHSGGRMGQFRDFALASDIIIDGIDINGDSEFGVGETNQAFRVSGTRIAVINTRAIAGAYLWLGAAKHVIIANSNFYHGAATRSAMGISEGWGIRNTGGPITIIGSRVEGTRYHNIRVQSVGGTGELLYVSDSVLVAVHEGRTAWLWNNLSNGPWFGQGAIIENSQIFSFTAPNCVFGQQIDAGNVTYSRIMNNEFFGAGNAVFTQAYLDNNAGYGGQPGDHDWSVGNEFNSLTALPSWTGPGDPRTIPLPGGVPFSSGESPCSSPF